VHPAFLDVQERFDEQAQGLPVPGMPQVGL
jgi:hypothetical protein